MTDRELLLAVFNAIGAFAKRTTGDTMLLCTEDEEGNIVHIYPDDDRVTWISENSEGAEPHLGGYQVLRCKHCLLRDEPCASLPELRQVGQQSANSER